LADAQAAFQEATSAHAAAEGLMKRRDEIAARIAERKRQDAAAIESWVSTARIGSPVLSDAAELRRLEQEHAEAARVAEAAAGALPALMQRVQNAQRSVADAMAELQRSCIPVLEAEALTLVDEIRRRDIETVKVRSRLEACVRHLDRVGVVGRIAEAGAAGQRVRLKIPAPIGPTDGSIAAMVPAWKSFAERLLDEAAVFEV
jgi:hypothetical protein